MLGGHWMSEIVVETVAAGKPEIEDSYYCEVN